MATTPIAKEDPLAQVSSVLELIHGKPGTTSTSKSNISGQGISAILQQILESNQGLASVASGQKTAGLYNSTVNQQMINDLMVRSSGELAKQQAGTTTTTKGNAPVQKGDVLTTLLTLGAKTLLGPTVKGIAKKTGVDTYGDKLAEALGFGTGGGSTAGGAVAGTAIDTSALGSGTAALGSDAAGGFGFDMTALGNGTALLGSDAAISAELGTDYFALEGAQGGASLAGAETAAASGATASEIGGAAGAGVGAETAGAEAAGSEGIGSAAGAGWGALAVYGALDLDSDLKSDDKDVLAADIYGGLGTGNILEAIESGNILDSLGPAGKTIICSEVYRQGLISKKDYLVTVHHGKTLSPITLRGYHVWAIPAVKAMRKSPKLTKFWTGIVKGRVAYLKGNKNFLGWISLYILQPMSTLIGVFVSEQNWKELYAK